MAHDVCAGGSGRRAVRASHGGTFRALFLSYVLADPVSPLLAKRLKPTAIDNERSLVTNAGMGQIRPRPGGHHRNVGLSWRKSCRAVLLAATSWSVLMRGDQQVIEYLNKALRHELAAVNQYWLHYRILDNWGYRGFAKKWRAESIEEMQHADKLVARILFLDGSPNMQSLDQLRIGRSVKEIIDCDLAAEMDARALYLQAAQYCLTVNDRVTQNLFEDLIT